MANNDASLNIENLISAMAKALAKNFGENIPIYKEKLEQGFQQPCICIRTGSIQYNKRWEEWQGKMMLHCPMDVLYYKEGEPRYKLHQYALEIIHTLKTIEIQTAKTWEKDRVVETGIGVIKGNNIQYIVAEDAVQVSVSYDLYGFEVSDKQPRQGRMLQNTTIK